MDRLEAGEDAIDRLLADRHDDRRARGGIELGRVLLAVELGDREAVALAEQGEEAERGGPEADGDPAEEGAEEDDDETDSSQVLALVRQDVAMNSLAMTLGMRTSTARNRRRAAIAQSTTRAGSGVRGGDGLAPTAPPPRVRADGRGGGGAGCRARSGRVPSSGAAAAASSKFRCRAAVASAALAAFRRGRPRSARRDTRRDARRGTRPSGVEPRPRRCRVALGNQAAQRRAASRPRRRCQSSQTLQRAEARSTAVARQRLTRVHRQRTERLQVGEGALVRLPPVLQQALCLDRRARSSLGVPSRQRRVRLSGCWALVVQGTISVRPGLGERIASLVEKGAQLDWARSVFGRT